MSDQATITIAGLGPGAPGEITLSVWEALRSSSCTYLRTGKHPVVDWLSRENISFSTFDYLYQTSASFEAVYLQIAEAVITAAQREPVLYAVPGHPLVAEESVSLIIKEAEQRGLSIDLLPAVSFVDVVCTALRLDPGLGLQIVDGLQLEHHLPLQDRPALISQVYSRLVAADVKVSLLELYPPEHRVTVIRAAGLPGEERIAVLPLSAIDRLEWIDHLTSLYLPEVGCRKVNAEYNERNGQVGLRCDDGQVCNQNKFTVNRSRCHEEEKTKIYNGGEAVEVIQVYEHSVPFAKAGRRALKVCRQPKSGIYPGAG